MSKSTKKLTIDIFVVRANKKHNYKYDYSKFVYINCRTKSIIICPEHGEFLQNPHDHLKGKVCHKCSGTQLKNLEQFINEATKFIIVNIIIQNLFILIIGQRV